ncbi:DMT family transporter [Motilimonas pumila]|uniref:DMT family transporter n=1 Tax=Motilimonas pumila TaxID=2303987 RepID=A0A418YBQ0_9GAMM|nr:DMT family transporter [Motilimonas pumila]RJG41911.1 DMT family transporter [Motilimonas pumila]
MKKTNILAICAGLGVIFIWSGWITLSRAGVQTALSPWDISLLRFGTATLITSVLWWRYPWRQVNWWHASIIALTTGAIYTVFSFYGMNHASAANTGVIVNGFLPVFGALVGAWWLGSKPAKLAWLAIFIILCANLLLLFQHGWQAFLSSKQWLASLLLLVASLSLASYMVAVKAFNYGIKDVLVMVPLINTIVLLPCWLLLPTEISQVAWVDIATQAIYQGVVVTLCAGILFTYCIRHLGPLTGATMMAFVPAVTAVLAWFFLAEGLTQWDVAALVVCTLGLMLYSKASAKA